MTTQQLDTVPMEMPARAPARSRYVGGGAIAMIIGLVGTILLVRVAVLSRTGQQLDAEATEALHTGRGALEPLLSALGTISTGTVALALAACVVLALIRRRFAAAGAAVLIVGGANVTTQLIKLLVDRPNFGDGSHNSLPSGHTTVVVSIVLAALLVAPVGLRALSVLLGSFAIVFIGISTVVAGWHLPSDVLAALTVTLAWAGLAVLLLSLRPTERPTGGVGAFFLAALGAGAGVIALVVTGVRPDGGWSGIEPALTVLAVIMGGTALTVAWFTRLTSAHAR
ncbi:phosphatase PAP2 family protein [Microlunatus parietis]|uniref:Phosphatidic acid phosphatase type 2/haloperoxidase domain-containing protein n=1 Tax=Microlunatus parietis TaxID=682979 RepID=A0A7Y9LC90_9ACTN|nr:phosphatase PAP2 family protein [Microlunatus parietis]NYE71460.1 hypothetical protein [Microlunatus parietis]